VLRQVSCVNKHPSHFDAHTRIQFIGGGGWKHSETNAITWIKSGQESYWVSVGGRSVPVVVATHEGREYLKTTADGYAPNNLLSLPEC
jgi:uncharacterized protein DUF3892